ncbi:MAG TPA: Gfo/Idh/MocA family oxidoreductase [Acidimicrobiales bacterium]|jgi:predicted dehydrogenase|nr:Gfo/Idh/MocA family oxidoreductase [Acidimicrobiales bacterium]
MRTVTAPGLLPPRLLVLAGDPIRAGLLKSLAATADVTVVGGATSSLPGPAGFGAIIVDQLPIGADASWITDLQEAVHRGACLLAIVPPEGATPSEPATADKWWELLGARPTGYHPPGEWFAKKGFGVDELSTRVPDEFGLTDSLIVLDGQPDSVAVLNVSVAFADRPVLLSRRLGAGRVVASGLGTSLEALRHPEVRTILKRALVAPSVLASSSRSVGLAVLGYGPYGGMGLYHGLAAQATAGFDLVAACDSDAGRRKAAEAEFPGLRAYDGVHDLIADDDVGLVIVATPPSTHHALALELIEAGKHVALEKPMCLTVAEATHLMEAAAGAGVALTVHQSRRWDADFVAIKGCVDQGVLGDVFSAETFVGGFDHPCRAWHSEVSVSGGAVYDWGSHHLDWLLQLMGGFPVQLSAHGHKRVWHDVTNLDQVRVRLTWADGREAEFVQSDVAAVRRPKFYIQGTAGTLVGTYRPVSFERLEPGLGLVSEAAHHAEAPAELHYGRYEAGAGVSITSVPLPVVPRFGFHRNLADHLQFGEPLAVDPASARRVVALLEAAQRSTDEGNIAVDLPEL